MPDPTTGTGGPHGLAPSAGGEETSAEESPAEAVVSPLLFSMLQRLIILEAQASQARVAALEQVRNIRFLVIDSEEAEAEIARLQKELSAAERDIKRLNDELSRIGDEATSTVDQLELDAANFRIEELLAQIDELQVEILRLQTELADPPDDTAAKNAYAVIREAARRLLNFPTQNPTLPEMAAHMQGVRSYLLTNLPENL